jgi:predicted flap endonuclease-1-like 5' DNA nuclease
MTTTKKAASFIDSPIPQDVIKVPGIGKASVPKLHDKGVTTVGVVKKYGK